MPATPPADPGTAELSAADPPGGPSVGSPGGSHGSGGDPGPATHPGKPAGEQDEGSGHGSYRLPSQSDPEHPGDSERRLAVLLYSDDMDTRAQVRLAVGRRPAAGLPEVAWTECATQPAVLAAVDAGGLDVLILDGEAAPSGGMGLCKQLKDEIYQCPPVLVLTGRPQDAWLATWSRADVAVPHPLDPVAVAEAVATLARRRLAS